MRLTKTEPFSTSVTLVLMCLKHNDVYNDVLFHAVDTCFHQTWSSSF